MSLLVIRNSWVGRKIEELEKEMKTALPYSKQYLEGRVDMLKEIDRRGLLKDNNGERK